MTKNHYRFPHGQLIDILHLLQTLSVTRDVALILHSHILAPFHFATDIKSSARYASLNGRLDIQLFRYASRLQNLRMGDENSLTAWKSKYPSLPFQVFEVTEDVYRQRTPFFARLICLPSPHPPALRFSVNLADAVIRQWKFSQKITNHYLQDPVPKEALNHTKLRYIKFMNLMRLQNETVVPSLDIDLFWHTHQLSTLDYDRWCRQWVGRPINHDDTIGENRLTDGLEHTKRAWMKNYNEQYLGPAPEIPMTVQNAHHIKFVRPPPTLSPFQKQLWEFDVAKQKKHEEYEWALLQINEQYPAGNIDVVKANLAAANVELMKARLQNMGVYLADMRARSAAMGRPGTHPDLPIGYENKGFWSKLFTYRKVMKPIFKEREAAIKAATQPQQDVVDQLKAVIDDYETRTNALINRYDRDRNVWREQRWLILQKTGGVGVPPEEKHIAFGMSYTKPGIDAIEFPLYATNWYMLVPVGAYDYSSKFERDRLGTMAGGFLCGSQMNGGIQPSCSSCG
jgi:hypothetical protein